MYRWLERQSEIELLIEDDSPEAVLTETLVAIGDLLTEERGGESVTHDVGLMAEDFPGLLGEWIVELVRLAETDGFIPERVATMELADSRLTATVGGQRRLSPGAIRRVTYDRLALEEVEGEWRATVILRT